MNVQSDPTPDSATAPPIFHHWTASLFHRLVSLRLGPPDQPTTFWHLRGELLHLTTGRLLASVEGLEAMRRASASDTAVSPDAPLTATQTHLCHKLYLFRPPEALDSLDTELARRRFRRTWRSGVRIDDPGAVCQVLEYPRQTVTYALRSDQQMEWTAQRIGDRHQPIRATARVAYVPGTFQVPLPPSPHDSLTFPLHVRVEAPRRQRHGTAAAFEAYELCPESEVHLPWWQFWRQPARWLRPPRTAGGARLRFFKVADCPSWCDAPPHSRCVLMLRGRRFHSMRRVEDDMSATMAQLLQQPGYAHYCQPPDDILEAPAPEATHEAHRDHLYTSKHPK